MSGTWSPAPVGGFGGVQPPGPAVGRAENGAEREKKKELFRRALEEKKKGKKEKKDAGPDLEAAPGEGRNGAGTLPEGEGRLTGEGGHKVDVLA